MIYYVVNRKFKYRYRLLIALACMHDALVKVCTLGVFGASAGLHATGLATRDYIQRIKDGRR